jgi:hypothetical protein
MGFIPTNSEKYDSPPKYMLHLSSQKFVQAYVMFNFAIHSDELELGNTPHPILASTISVAAPQTS